MTSNNGQSITTEQLAERWQRRPQWVTQAANRGEIPGAWKLGHLWRFRLGEIEAYELAQQTPNIFALSPGAAARRRNKEQRERDLLEPLPQSPGS